MRLRATLQQQQIPDEYAERIRRRIQLQELNRWINRQHSYIKRTLYGDAGYDIKKLVRELCALIREREDWLRENS